MVTLKESINRLEVMVVHSKDIPQTCIIHLPLCCTFRSKFPILSFHRPEGSSPQLNKVVNFQFVRFLLRKTMSTLRLRVRGDMIPLGACNSRYRYPRRAKSRSTLTWTCSKNFISQLLTVKKTSDGMTLQLQIGITLPYFRQ